MVVILSPVRWWRAELDRVAGHVDEGLLQRGLAGGELEQGDPGRRRGPADLVGGQPRDGQGAILVRRDLGARPEQRGQRFRVGAPDPHGVACRGGDELPHAGVGDQPAPADDDQVLRGQGHLVHQVRGDEHGPALGGQVPEQRPDPADALGVEAVDRLVEDHRVGVAEQRRGDAEPLAHAEGEAAGPPAGHLAQAHRVDHLVHPGAADAAGLGDRQQVVVGAAARVDRAGIQQRADLAERRRVPAVRLAVDGHRPACRRVQPEDHPHGGRLAGAVRPEEAGDHARPHREAQVVDRQLAAIPFGQPVGFDHLVRPLRSVRGAAWQRDDAGIVPGRGRAVVGAGSLRGVGFSAAEPRGGRMDGGSGAG
jgi:hypothetical protein